METPIKAEVSAQEWSFSLTLFIKQEKCYTPLVVHLPNPSCNTLGSTMQQSMANDMTI